MRPTKSFLVGERPGAAAREVASWQWWSDWGEWDIEPQLTEMLRVLGPHQSLFRHEMDKGASLGLSIVCRIDTHLVATKAEADARRVYAGELEDFQPFLDSDRPSIYLDQAVLSFLTAIGCELDIYVETGLDRGT